jgi:lipopolysaccharide biosynthesis protein
MKAMQLLQRLRAAEDKFEHDVARIIADVTGDEAAAAAHLTRKYHKQPKVKSKAAKKSKRKNVVVENGKTTYDFAKAVLVKHGDKMHLSEIVSAMKKRGWKTQSKNPAAMMGVTLRKPEAKKFHIVPVGDGQFAVNGHGA